MKEKKYFLLLCRLVATSLKEENGGGSLALNNWDIYDTIVNDIQKFSKKEILELIKFDSIVWEFIPKNLYLDKDILEALPLSKNKLLLNKYLLENIDDKETRNYLEKLY